MWNNSLGLFAGGGEVTIVCDSDTLVGDLYSFIGNPSSAVDVLFTADGCDVGNIIITLDFAALSTFTFIAVNGGRFIGLGGDGGGGGDDLGISGTVGSPGVVGGHAIESNTFDVSIDIDDGFLLGGGGGGGGGSWWIGAQTPGGGGGGGAGFLPTTGGIAGTGSPAATAGGDGNNLGPGASGNGGSGPTNGGGIGGDFGLGGITGGTVALSTGLRGGQGGRAGNAFRGTGGAAISFDGTGTESVLRLASRLRGETEFLLNVRLRVIHASVSGMSTHGWQFGSTGQLSSIYDGTPSGFASDWMLPPFASGNGDNYWVRGSGVLGQKLSTWDTGLVDGTWYQLTSTRSWTFSKDQFWTAGQLFEIQRTDMGADEVIASMYLFATDENGV